MKNKILLFDDIIDLEYQLGENQRHCEALDAFLEEEE